jgi:hypothetical protein
MLHKSTQHAIIGYVTGGSVTAFAAGRARMMWGVCQSGGRHGAAIAEGGGA